MKILNYPPPVIGSGRATLERKALEEYECGNNIAMQDMSREVDEELLQDWLEYCADMRIHPLDDDWDDDWDEDY